jgi:hypothetical protein
MEESSLSRWRYGRSVVLREVVDSPSKGCAAPHCPAGHFSPYGDGEKDAVIDDFANHRRCKKDADAASLLPVTLREKVPAGSTDLCDQMVAYHTKIAP